MQFQRDPGGTPGPDTSRRGRGILASLVLAVLATAVFASSASASLSSFGPIDPSNNFPSFYKDANGVALKICEDGPPNCLAGPELLQDVHAAGGDAEAFYWAADATTAHFALHDALEAAYAADGPNQEVVFQRTQVTARAGGLPTNTKYTVTDPYGTLTCTTDATGTIRQNACRTETTPVEGEFNRALNGRMGPFLTWDTYGQAAPVGPPAGYIGDNTTPHKVVGSPTGFNAFRVVGDGLTGTCTNPDGSTVSNCEQTDLFVVQGKVQPGASSVVTPTGPVDFGNIALGSVTKTLTYTSTGSDPVTVTDVAPGGADPGDFSVTNNCALAGALAPGAKCTIDVKFTPRANAASAATLSITDSASTTARTIALKGSSLPEMSVVAGSLDPTTPPSLAFGSQPVGSTSAENVFIVHNTGPVDAHITGRTLGGSAPGHYTLTDTTNTCATDVAPDATCEIGVRFAPTTTGGKPATLTLTDSGGTKLPAIPLSGTGAAAQAVAPPTVTPATGTYTSAQSVTMTAAAGTTIRYTVGTGTTVPADPTATTGTLYSGPVSVSSSQVIRARAFANGVGSSVVQRDYTINIATAPAAPTVTPASGSFTAPVTATMTADPGTTIRFTVGIGTSVPVDPTATTGQVYNPAAPPTWTASRVVKIRAFNAGGTGSTVVQRNYTITAAPAPTVAAPTVNPASGTFTAPVTGTMTAAAGTTIRYTVGIGTTVPADPTATTGQLYNASTPPTWTASRVVRIAAFDAAGTRSAIVQRNYTITVAAVAAPTVNPASGTFTGSVTATMTADPGTTIRFTVGIGTNVPADPTATTGQVYNPAAPPRWTASRVVKIRAFNSSGVASTVVRRNYTITP